MEKQVENPSLLDLELLDPSGRRIWLDLEFYPDCRNMSSVSPYYWIEDGPAGHSPGFPAPSAGLRVGITFTGRSLCRQFADLHKKDGICFGGESIAGSFGGGKMSVSRETYSQEWEFTACNLPENFLQSALWLRLESFCFGLIKVHG